MSADTHAHGPGHAGHGDGGHDHGHGGPVGGGRGGGGPGGGGKGHGHGHPHGHSHAHGIAAGRAGARHRGRLVLAVAVLGVVLVAEVVAGLLTGSLALLSDAGHMVTDVMGIGMALAAIHVADRAGARRDRTYGLYRLEILAALANAVLLFGVAVYVLVEAVARIGDPPHVAAGPVLAVAVVGLVANVVAFLLLREGSSESLNVEGAYLEVLSDLVGSVGVILGTGLMALTGWGWVDPVVGVGIGLFILPRTWRLARQAVRILVQAAPEHTDVEALDAALRALDDVVDVHDLHVWTLTSEMDVASAHLMTRADADAHGVLDRARVLLSERFGIDHATLQVEPETHVGCNELTW